jgi:tRNA-specific 2-thiouridylase
MVAMSGGVDSAVTAALVRDMGHEVVGVTMRLWGGDSDSGCCSVSEVDEARWAANALGIDHLVFNFAEDFETHVVNPYVADHLAGLTPNPCIECNRHLKFDRLLARATALGFDAVATGHHAQVLTSEPEGEAESGPRLRRVGRGADSLKDQSYVLYTLTAQDLERVMFPIGTMTKARVRELAGEYGLAVAGKPDSQDVCFITSDKGRAGFMADRQRELTPGVVVDESGHPVGTVTAVELVTIGQRKGLGLSGEGERRYVVDIDRETATVRMGSAEELLRATVRLETMVWPDRPLAPGAAVLAQVSAHGNPTPGTWTGDGVQWDSPQKRVAPGQSVVLYEPNNRWVIGGGIAQH